MAHYIANNWLIIISILLLIALLVWRKLFGKNSSHKHFDYIAVVGVFITIVTTLTSSKLEDDKMFKELFKDFNERFDKLNCVLNLVNPAVISTKDTTLITLKALAADRKIRVEEKETKRIPIIEKEISSYNDSIVLRTHDGTKVTLLEKDIENVIYDYINLCAEEYLWYTKGRISESIWLTWTNGMKPFFEKKKIYYIYRLEKAKNKSDYYDGFFAEMDKHITIKK